jgi:hypothetical protein
LDRPNTSYFNAVLNRSDVKLGEIETRHKEADMLHLKTAAFAAAITFMTVAQGYALSSWFPGATDGPQQSRSAPGPILGVGIPVALVAGGYVWFRRRAKNRK